MGVNVEQFEKECLDEHNRLRALHGSPPLKLNRELCTYAKEWAHNLAETKQMQHRPNPIHGENIFMSKGGTIDGKIPVSSWYSEIKDYNFAESTFGMNTGHFTQVVWKGSQELGVGIEEIGDLRFVVANYKPPGNFMNQFKENVLKKQRTSK